MVKRPLVISRARPRKKPRKKFSIQRITNLVRVIHKTPTHPTQCAWCTKRPPHAQERFCLRCIEKDTIFIDKGDKLPGPGEKESLVCNVAREYSCGAKCIMLIVKGAHNTPAEYVLNGNTHQVSNIHIATYPRNGDG